jgi:hypothetical protein
MNLTTTVLEIYNNTRPIAVHGVAHRMLKISKDVTEFDCVKRV